MLTTLANIADHIDTKRIDFLIQLDPNVSTLAALQAVPPLQMICYYTALQRGNNPDKQIFDAIDYLEQNI